ncbi:TPA: hypothetical protein EYP66_17050 [Candidatus Poribacteria bacterium]|nr:hypothetical protein [Candidatus Poribacteria bacterium]
MNSTLGFMIDASLILVKFGICGDCCCKMPVMSSSEKRHPLPNPASLGRIIERKVSAKVPGIVRSHDGDYVINYP